MRDLLQLIMPWNADRDDLFRALALGCCTLQYSRQNTHAMNMCVLQQENFQLNEKRKVGHAQ